MPLEDIHVLFANARTILAVNAELLRSLEHNLAEAAADGTQQLSKAVSTSFRTIMPFFRTYTEVSATLRCFGCLICRCVLIRTG